MTEIDPTDPRVKDALAHNKQLGGSRVISYQGMDVLAPVRDIRDAVELLNSHADRQRVMVTVNKALTRTLPAVKRRTASQQDAMNFGQDVAIWFANEIIEGRASLEMN